MYEKLYKRLTDEEREQESVLNNPLRMDASDLIWAQNRVIAALHEVVEAQASLKLRWKEYDASNKEYYEFLDEMAAKYDPTAEPSGCQNSAIKQGEKVNE